MSLPKSVPLKPVNGFKFLAEVDFTEYKKRLVGEASPEAPVVTAGKTLTAPANGNGAAVPSPRIPRVVGFLNEAAQVQEILTSSLTNSVYVTGEEGVGKSALLLSFLNNVAMGEVAPALLGKHYFVFNLHEFFKLPSNEQITQFDAAMDYMAKKNSLIILDRFDDFVLNCGPDRARRLMGSLINALENQSVGALITAQPANHAAIDQTSTLFSRVFKKLQVEPRTAEEAKNILRQMAPRFEKTYKVAIGDDAISEIIRLDQRFEGRLPGQSPNRLVEFLDQLAASVNIAKYGKSKALLEQEMQLVELQGEEDALKVSVKPSAKKLAEVQGKIAALKQIIQPQLDAWNKKFGALRKTREKVLEAQTVLAPLQERVEAGMAFKDKELMQRELAKQEKRDITQEEWDRLGPKPEPLTAQENKNRDNFIMAERALRTDLATLETQLYAEAPHVTVNDVQTRFAKVTGVTGASSTNDADRLLGIEKELSKTVFGQDPAKRVLANVLRTRDAGTSDPTRPAGVILFSGPPGCGKTEMVEQIAALTGSPLITYNMSEYTDSSAVSKLVGAAPGLVGFGETKTLPSAVKEAPKAIVFFDEIEKAHTNMQRAIMQIMDKGKMKDEFGNDVSFKDCVIVMASNILSPEDLPPGEQHNDKSIRAKLIEKKNPQTDVIYFLKEFIGRIDAVEIFDYVTPEIADMILHKNIRDINKGIAARGYQLEMDDATAAKIVEANFDKTQGGRSIKQLSNKVIRPLTTDCVLNRQASEKPGEDGELRNMIVGIDANEMISIDGHTLGDQEAETAGPSRPQVVINAKSDHGQEAHNV